MSTSAGFDKDRSSTHKQYFENERNLKNNVGYMSRNSAGFTYYNTNAPIDKVRQSTVAPTTTTCNFIAK